VIKDVYYEGEDFKLSITVVNNEVFLHCLVYDWKLSSLRKGFKIFGRMMKELKENGFNEIYSISPNPKFCEMMGGRSIGILEKEGLTYEVFKWDLTL